ncbi:curli-like amyloid fiber formation chaperone CsgH [Cupriavidus necator]|uniref:curli-like amyloid fiber formation chaperone CsgH n=1 Tax=Cupriavidus necator TaxID=106590 RepID=UPI00339D7A3C
MQADMNLQVWLDIQSANGTAQIAPYVASAHEAELQYEVKVSTRSGNAASSAAQAGTVHVVPGQPVRVSTLTVAPHPAAVCEVGLVLRQGMTVLGRYKLDCSGRK